MTEHALRNSASASLLSASYGSRPKPRSSTASKSAGDLALVLANANKSAANDTDALPAKTPQSAKFEFHKSVGRQASNSSFSSGSAHNVVVGSNRSSVDNNAKYLSVIDLYDDDGSLATQSPRDFATPPRNSLRIDARRTDLKEPVYSPVSLGSFNFVSKGFESVDDLHPRQSEERSMRRSVDVQPMMESVMQPAINSLRINMGSGGNSGNSDNANDGNTSTNSNNNSKTSIINNTANDSTKKAIILQKQTSQDNLPTPTIDSSDTQKLHQSEENLHQQQLSTSTDQTNRTHRITPVSYATTPSIGHAVSANVTVQTNDAVRNLIANNQSMLSLQSAKSVNSQALNSHKDRYGFRKKTAFVTEDQYNVWWRVYEPYLVRRKRKWVHLMLQNGLNLNKDNPVRFPPKSNKLKRYVRKGIPAEWRGNAWWYFARGDEKLSANPGLYDKIVHNTAGIKTRDAEIIERDLNRTFPDNEHFKSSDGEEPALIQSLRRVLVAFAIYQPQIGYCQSLNFLAGLLLIFLDEERTFWMLVIITSRLLPGVHDVNLEGVNVDQGVLMLCVKEYLPAVWEKIGFNFEQAGVDGKQNFSNEVNVVTKLPPITLCTASWFMSAFIGILPIETCLRVWDCFFYEESKVFFRMALSILKLAEPQIERVKDEMEVFQIIQNFPKKLLEPKQLFECCFKKRNGFGNISQEEINRCRQFVKEQRKKAVDMPVVEDLSSEMSKLKNDIREEDFVPDEYDFKKNGLAGVHWKASLTRKLRKRKKEGEFAR